MGVLELRDLIAPSALRVSPNDLNLGAKIARTFFTMSYPRFLSEGWFSPIINLDKVFDVSITITPIDTTSALKTLQKKVAEVSSQISDREEKGMVRDPMLDVAYQDIEKLRDELQQATEKIFNVGLYITIYGDNEDDLNHVENEIKSMLDAKLVYINRPYSSKKTVLKAFCQSAPTLWKFYTASTPRRSHHFSRLYRST